VTVVVHSPVGSDPNPFVLTSLLSPLARAQLTVMPHAFAQLLSVFAWLLVFFAVTFFDSKFFFLSAM
jgi:hypothetical protein